MSKNRNQEAVEQTAKNIKDKGDTAFDNVQNAVESAESAAMNTVDKSADAINKRMDRKGNQKQ